MRCEICPPAKECPDDAITDQIDLLKCDGCGLCVTLCSYGAIRGGLAKLNVRDVDSRNVTILKELMGITVINSPQKVSRLIEKL